MATITLTRDDLDPTVTEGVEPVALAYKGKQVLVDLGPDNRARLEEFLSPFVAAGRSAETTVVKAKVKRPRAAKPATTQPVTDAAATAAPVAETTASTTAVNGVTKLKRAKAATASTEEPKLSRAEAAKENEECRVWAAAQGIDLNPRGRIPNDVKAQFRAQRTAPAAPAEALSA